MGAGAATEISLRELQKELAEALQLYRRVLRVHRMHLPARAPTRQLADSFAAAEFRSHMAAATEAAAAAASSPSPTRLLLPGPAPSCSPADGSADVCGAAAADASVAVTAAPFSSSSSLPVEQLNEAHGVPRPGAAIEKGPPAATATIINAGLAFARSGAVLAAAAAIRSAAKSAEVKSAVTLTARTTTAQTKLLPKASSINAANAASYSNGDFPTGETVAAAAALPTPLLLLRLLPRAASAARHPAVPVLPKAAAAPPSSSATTAAAPSTLAEEAATAAPSSAAEVAAAAPRSTAAAASLPLEAAAAATGVSPHAAPPAAAGPLSVVATSSYPAERKEAAGALVLLEAALAVNKQNVAEKLQRIRGGAGQDKRESEAAPAAAQLDGRAVSIGSEVIGCEAPARDLQDLNTGNIVGVLMDTRRETDTRDTAENNVEKEKKQMKAREEIRAEEPLAAVASAATACMQLRSFNEAWKKYLLHAETRQLRLGRHLRPAERRLLSLDQQQQLQLMKKLASQYSSRESPD